MFSLTTSRGRRGRRYGLPVQRHPDEDAGPLARGQADLQRAAHRLGALPHAGQPEAKADGPSAPGVTPTLLSSIALSGSGHGDPHAATARRNTG